MRYWYDTEFLEDGSTIKLVSIGIVAEDGREYYAVNSDMPVERINRHEWLMANVWPSLPLRGRKEAGYSQKGTPGVLDTSSSLVKPRWVIANEVRDFLLAGEDVELWAWYGAYDHVALAQLYGPMIRLPKGLPMFTHDVRQLVDFTGVDQLPQQAEGQHNALADARHVRVMHEHIVQSLT